MTTLGTLVKGYSLTVVPLASLDLTSLAASVAHLTASAGAPGPLGSGPAILASLAAWIHQDDDAHEPCSLVACRAPLHPGPCKGWKGTLAKVAPGTYKQVEEERVRKANERRVKRIAELRSQGKPIPKRLLTEIKPKPDPNTGIGGATATPLSKVNQQADLAGGQAHTQSQAISQQAGIKVSTANLPKGAKGKKPTVAGRGPAFVITQSKVTDQYKLDKAAKITPAEWDSLSPADKKLIRDELEAIKVRGFGPQQAKATALLAQLPAASTLGTSTSPTVRPPQVPSAAPGKTTLGQATKTLPRPSSSGASPSTPSAIDDAVAKASSGATTTDDVLNAADKVRPGDGSDAQHKALTDRLKFIASHPKATAAQAKRANDILGRLGAGRAPAAPAGIPATPPPAAKPTLPSPGPSAAPATPKPTLPSPGPAPTGPLTGKAHANSALAITEAVFGPQTTDLDKVAAGFDQMVKQSPTGNIKDSRNFKLLVDRLANALLKKASSANVPGLGHGDDDIHIGTLNKEIADHIANGKAGLPPKVAKIKAHIDGQKAGGSPSAPAGPAAPQPNAPAVSKATPASAPSGATPAPVAATPKPTLPSPGPTPPSPSATPATPAAAPQAFPPHVQTARAVAGRAVGRPTSKAHVDAYGKLTKADFDSLDAATQRTIRDDLANASAKFLDPAKKQAARDLLDRFGSRHTSPAPGAPAVPAHPKGYSDPQQQALKVVTTGGPDADVAKAIARLTPAQVKAYDDDDLRPVKLRLNSMAKSSKTDPLRRDEAAAYLRIIENGSPAEKSKQWDHAPSLGELHREEQASGVFKVADALKAADDTNMAVADRLKALGGLTKLEFGALSAADQRKILDALQLMHRNRIINGGKMDVDFAVEKAFDTYVSTHPGVHRLRQAESDWLAGKITPDQLVGALTTARAQTPGTGAGAASRAELDKEAARIGRSHTKLPLYARASLIGGPKYGDTAYDAIVQASNSFNWDPAPRLSDGDLKKLFRPTDAHLAAVDPIHAEAVRELQIHTLKTGLKGQPGVGSPWSTATRNAAVETFLGIGAGGEIPRERLAAYKALPQDVQALVKATVRAKLDAQTNFHAKTDTFIAYRELEGLPPLTGEYRDAFLAATDPYSVSGKLDIYRKLAPTDFQSMPDYTKDAIRAHLVNIQANALQSGAVHRWQNTDNALRVLPGALAAHLNGDRPGAGLPRNERNVADFALYGTGIVHPQDRIAAYNKLTPTQLDGLPSQVRTAVHADLGKIENDGALPLQTRYDAAMNGHVYLRRNAAITLTPAQVTAAQAADNNPASRYGDAAAESAFQYLSKSDFDGLPRVLRDAIDERIKTLPGAAQQSLNAKFHPQAAAATPAGTVPTMTQANVPANVQTALDVIYGTNPKGHTTAAQLSAYGGLRGADFAQLNVQEQQQLLSDLSYIATTAKGPSADKARKLIDRFTPPGTPAGQLPPNPAVIPPANSVPGQVRYATPQVGTLVMAKDKGKGGDGWVSTPGGRRVWGKYGAAGLLLRHVDPATGEKRYLMVQRGPGISDPGKWQFPGGAIDEKETFHQGGAREVIEELGFKPDDLKTAGVVGEHTSSIPGSTWKYVSIAADVPSMLKPDLSSHHAQMETSDAKWMTEAEIRALDTSGKLLAPLAGGKLEQNVMSLFPAASGAGKLGQVARPGPVTRRQNRLAMPPGGRQAPAAFNAWPHAHKPSKGKNLVPDKAAINAMRQKIKNDAPLYDGKTADGRLAAIGAMQGFDDTPTVLDKKEIDRLLATGDYIEAWRGVTGAGGGWSARSRGSSTRKTAAEINEEMRTGPAYYGKGIFGNGYYLATDKRVAAQYSDHTPGSMVRILIPKSAVSEKYDKVEREAQANSSRYSKNTAKTPGSDPYSTFWDPGRWAAAKGVDGIEINPGHRAHGGGGAGHVASVGKPAFNWLNRSVLIIQKEPG